MNQLKVFENPEFGKIRTVTVNDEPWFVGKDVAIALGYRNTKDALSKHVDAEDKLQNDGVAICDPMGREQHPVVINESGLYSLILFSKLPSAKEFKRWVTHEVLPAIRKNGGYIAGQEHMNDQEILAKALLVAQRTIESKNQVIEQMEPKALFADAVSAGGNTILIGELAKMIRQNGVDMGEKRLFAWMRDNGYLIRRNGTDYNMPTQKSIELGLMRVKETVITHSDGHTTVSKTTKITGKGQQYFINKFLEVS